MMVCWLRGAGRIVGVSYDGDDHDFGSTYSDAHVEIDSCKDDGKDDENQLDNVLPRLVVGVEPL